MPQTPSQTAQRETTPDGELKMRQQRPGHRENVQWGEVKDKEEDGRTDQSGRMPQDGGAGDFGRLKVAVLRIEDLNAASDVVDDTTPSSILDMDAAFSSPNDRDSERGSSEEIGVRELSVIMKAAAGVQGGGDDDNGSTPLAARSASSSWTASAAKILGLRSPRGSISRGRVSRGQQGGGIGMACMALSSVLLSSASESRSQPPPLCSTAAKAIKTTPHKSRIPLQHGGKGRVLRSAKPLSEPLADGWPRDTRKAPPATTPRKKVPLQGPSSRRKVPPMSSPSPSSNSPRTKKKVVESEARSRSRRA